jgi:hypothetical protein
MFSRPAKHCIGQASCHSNHSCARSCLLWQSNHHDWPCLPPSTISEQVGPYAACEAVGRPLRPRAPGALSELLVIRRQVGPLFSFTHTSTERSQHDTLDKCITFLHARTHTEILEAGCIKISPGRQPARRRHPHRRSSPRLQFIHINTHWHARQREDQHHAGSGSAWHSSWQGCLCDGQGTLLPRTNYAN